MGRVLAYDEIVCGWYPTDEDFATAVDIFQDAVHEKCDNGSLIGGFVYGSVAIGAANWRSDMDVLFTTPGAQAAHYGSAQNVVSRIRESTGGRVPVSAIVLDHEALTEGRHDIDRYFGQHLTCQERLVVGADPADAFTYPPASAFQLLGNYVAHKKRRLAESYMTGMESEIESRLGLQRLLELPLAVGRKALQACNESGVTDLDPGNTANKIALTGTLTILMAQHGLVTEFEELLALNDDYNEVLRNARYDSNTEQQYRSELKRLYFKLPVGLKWLDRVEKAFLPRLSEEVV